MGNVDAVVSGARSTPTRAQDRCPEAAHHGGYPGDQGDQYCNATVLAFEQYEPNRGDRQRKLQKLEREEEQERERASARASDTE